MLLLRLCGPLRVSVGGLLVGLLLEYRWHLVLNPRLLELMLHRLLLVEELVLCLLLLLLLHLLLLTC